LNTNLSPIQLFFICYFKYPQTFLFRTPLVNSEVKVSTLKFKQNDENKHPSKPISNKFVQKQHQFFNLISMGGVLECNLNEIVEDYDRISNNKSGKLQLEFIQETQSCLSLNQKDFCSPFSMYFLLDQKIDFVENEVKEADKSAEPHIPDEETEQTEDYVTDLYLHLFQDKSIPQILKDEGYDPQVYHQEERKEKKPKSKNKKGEKGITEEENKKQIEEEKKKETDEIETIKKTNLQQKRQIMRGVLVKERELHLERVNQLWNEFTSIIIKSFEQAKTYGNIDQSKATSGQKEVIHSLNSIRYIWKIFNRLVEDALAVKHATFLNNDKNKDFVIKALKFVESCMQQFTTRPITSFNSIEWKWIRCFFRYCNIVITQCSTDLKQVDFAKNMLPTYMKIIGTMNKFLGVYNESRLSPPDPLLDKKNEDNKMPLIGNYLGKLRL